MALLELKALWVVREKREILWMALKACRESADFLAEEVQGESRVLEVSTDTYPELEICIYVVSEIPIH